MTGGGAEDAETAEVVEKAKDSVMKKLNRAKKLKAFFYTLDADRSKSVDKEELANALIEAAQEGGDADMKEVVTFLNSRANLEEGETLTEDHLMAMIDKNNDKEVSWEEWLEFVGDADVAGMMDADPWDDRYREEEKRREAERRRKDKERLAEIAREKEEDRNGGGGKLGGGSGSSMADVAEADRLAKMAAKRRRQQQEKQEAARNAKADEDARRRKERERRDADADAEQRRAAMAAQEREMAALRADMEAQMRRQQEEMARQLKAQQTKGARERKDDERRRRDAAAKAKAAREPRPPDHLVGQWKMYHVQDWVAGDLELPQYLDYFKDGAVDGMLLLALTEEDLHDDLGMEVRLHRKKLLRAVGRLRALQDEYLEKQSKKKAEDGRWGKGLRSESLSPKKKKRGKGKKRGKEPKLGSTYPAAGAMRKDNVGELLKMRLQQRVRAEAKADAREAKDDVEHTRRWAFEYGDPSVHKNARGGKPTGGDGMWDWYDHWGEDFEDEDDYRGVTLRGKQQGGQGGSNKNKMPSRDVADLPSGESRFRDVMSNLRARITEKVDPELLARLEREAGGGASSSGGGNDGGNGGGGHVYQSYEEKDLLVPEGWSEGHLPWWMGDDADGHGHAAGRGDVFSTDEGGDGGGGRVSADASGKALTLKRLPSHATSEEVLAVVKNAVWLLGREIGKKRQRNLKVGDFDGDGDVDDDDFEARLLDDAYNLFVRLERNGGAHGERTGLTRMKFQGGLKVLLGLDLRWEQYVEERERGVQREMCCTFTFSSSYFLMHVCSLHFFPPPPPLSSLSFSSSSSQV